MKEAAMSARPKTKLAHRSGETWNVRQREYGNDEYGAGESANVDYDGFAEVEGRGPNDGLSRWRSRRP
jgi:hypothetical protein